MAASHDEPCTFLRAHEMHSFPMHPETLPNTEAYRRMRQTLRVKSAVPWPNSLCADTYVKAPCAAGFFCLYHDQKLNKIHGICNLLYSAWSCE